MRETGGCSGLATQAQHTLRTMRTRPGRPRNERPRPGAAGCDWLGAAHDQTRKKKEKIKKKKKKKESFLKTAGWGQEEGRHTHTPCLPHPCLPHLPFRAPVLCTRPCTPPSHFPTLLLLCTCSGRGISREIPPSGFKFQVLQGILFVPRCCPQCPNYLGRWARRLKRNVHSAFPSAVLHCRQQR